MKESDSFIHRHLARSKSGREVRVALGGCHEYGDIQYNPSLNRHQDDTLQ